MGTLAPVRLALAAGRGVTRRVRRRVFILRIKVLCLRHWARVRVVVDRSAEIALRVGVEIRRAARGEIVIGPRAVLQPEVRIRFFAGRLFVGPDAEIRRGALLQTHGDLLFEGRNIVSWRAYVQANESVTFRVGAMCAQNCTVIDSNHYFPTPGSEFDDTRNPSFHFVRSAPVELGENVWLAVGAVVTSGCTVGHHSVVGANAVVTRDVPPWSLASGVPAQVHPLPASLRPEIGPEESALERRQRRAGVAE